jgi:uncharacterized Rmd1/YagE family protein
MNPADEWNNEFVGNQFDSMATEFHYYKLAKEIDQVDDVRVLRDMLKQYIKINLKEKELLKKIGSMPLKPINTEE